MFGTKKLKERIQELEDSKILQSNHIRRLDAIIHRLFKVGDSVYIQLEGKFIKVKIQSIETVGNQDRYYPRHFLFPYGWNSYVREVHYHNYYSFDSPSLCSVEEKNIYSEEMFKEICKCKDLKK